ncbi:MAG TPA: hypothetical protein VMO26_27465 [Vicinamibacterales bacterium]|nr:hypothetical protein [Vicinamibacterales bacterium]
MTFVRVSRDQRGYETTLLLHSPRPGDRPRVLYWYRTAPGVRVGRAPLDEEAIRTIEEQHPDIEFDWPQLFEEASNVPPDVERRPERPRRKSARPKEAPPLDATPIGVAAVVEGLTDSVPAVVFEPEAFEPDAPEPDSPPTTPEPSRAAVNPLLEQLVGREIATRLRARYAEVAARLEALEPGDARTAWQVRADALNPDRWPSPEAILAGIQNADRLFDELKRELP